MSSLQGELDTLKTIILNLSRRFGKGSKTANGLQSLYDSTQSVQISIGQSSFRQRSDAARLLTDVRDVTKLAFNNLQDLQFLIDPARDRSRGNSPISETEETSRNQAIFSNLAKHATSFSKIVDIIAGREDWSRLAPKAPRAPSVSPHSAARLQPAEQGKMTISMPASPYQPTIEDIDDADAEEELQTNVEHVHYVRKEESPIAPTTTTADKSHRRVLRPSTPPQVVIRQATDPRQFASPPRRAEASISNASASPLRTAAGADDSSDESGTEVERRHEHSLKPSPLPRLVTQAKQPSKGVKELQDEIYRLQYEIDKYATTSDTGSEHSRPDSRRTASGGLDSTLPDSTRPDPGKRKTSGKHHSVDLGHPNDALGTSSGRRPRASTGQTADRPKSFVEGSSFDPYRSEMPPPPRPDKLKRTTSQKSARDKTTRGLSRSPRTTPFSAVDPHYDNYWDYNQPQVPQTAVDSYGPDPRTSLPTVLERGYQDGRTGRPGARRHRNSSAFEDPRDNFRDFFAGDEPGAADFPLFGPPSGSGALTQRQPRSRGNSRAQDTSPNAKPYISPHQLHDSIDLEPDVREISVSLEDVFFGTIKKYKVRRDKYDYRTGIITQEERVLEVPISRGLKPRSKIKFEGEGHQTAEGTKELHFQLSEKAHPIFTRHDYDLHCTIELTLVEALCGWERSILSIDGKEVRFSHAGPTPHSWRDDRAGLGMCLFKRPEQRGDLIAAVSIRYPSPLTDMQKRLIRQAFAVGGMSASPRTAGGNLF